MRPPGSPGRPPQKKRSGSPRFRNVSRPGQMAAVCFSRVVRRQDRAMEVASGTAVWYHSASPPSRSGGRSSVTSRESSTRCHSKYRPGNDANGHGRYFVKRWQVEVTFEEVRAHLGKRSANGRTWASPVQPCAHGPFQHCHALGNQLSGTRN